MKLAVPQVDEIHPADAKLIRLAEFFGIPCERIPLARSVPPSEDYLGRAIRSDESCFVVNPQIFGRWLSSETSSDRLVSYLASRFPFIFVHNLSTNRLSTSTVRCLSGGRFQAVHFIEQPGLHYSISGECNEVLGPFSGLEFGPVNCSSDCVLIKGAAEGGFRTLISIDGQPFFASHRRERAEIFFFANGDIADLECHTDEKPLTEYFSRLVPPVMFFRRAFARECWRPNRPHATLIIDDPYLRENYGFFNYRRVLGLMDQCDFHTSIAFIPYNYQRSSRTIIRMFRERPDRYSLSVHGSDHTAQEFCTSDTPQLNAKLKIAVARMDIHQHRTGIPYDKVFVFPQDCFSVEALGVLKANNFCAAACSWPEPWLGAPSLSVGELAQPAITKYEGFPLFLRRSALELSPEDVAFTVFLGKPVLVAEHQGIFRHAECLAEVVARINMLVPGIRWSNLQTAIESSYLQRHPKDGTMEILAYAMSGQVNNDSEAPLCSSIMRRNVGQVALDHVVLDGKPILDFSIQTDNVRFSFILPPSTSSAFSWVYRNDFGFSNLDRGWQQRFKVFLRRRLSENRDNFLSKSPSLLSLVRSLQGRLRKR